MSSDRCYTTKAPEKGPSLIQHDTLVFQAHHVGWIITGIFTIVATVTSGWLLGKHLQWYTNKREQRYVIRLLFMVPIYAIISFASYLFWNHSTPLLLIRDGYESTVLTAFFYLLLTYLSPDPDEQKSIFLKDGLSRQADRKARNKGVPERKWMFPLGFVKWKPEDGLYFLQVMKWGVLQYVVIRPTTTLVAVVLDYAGLYCEGSWQLRWGHIYITVIVSISVTIAMYCLLQLYVSISQHLTPCKPLLKLIAIKAVVFLTFWQATFLSLLSTFGVVKNTKYMTANDINIGIGALLETFEMMIFAFIHIRAFTYKPYRPPYYPSSGYPPPTRTPRLRSLGHAMDFRETLREIWTGGVYVVDRMRGREPTPDKGARRVAYLEDVFGRARPGYGKNETTRRTLRGLGVREKNSRVGPLEVEVVEQVDVDVEGERQWLGLGDDYAYGLGYARREKSDGLGEQIEKELQRRGYGPEGPGRRSITAVPDLIDPGTSHARRRSWWRTIYDRISNDFEAGGPTRAPSKRKSRSNHSRNVNMDRRSLLFGTDYIYDELPPPSTIHMYQSQYQSSGPRQGQSRIDPADAIPPMPAYDPAQVNQQQPAYHRDSALSIARPHSPPPDSVLERIFPDCTEPISPTEPDHDGAPSILSSTAHGHTPSRTWAARSTPRASLMPATPVILQDSAVPYYQHNIHLETENLPSPMSAQVFGSPLGHSPSSAHVVDVSGSSSRLPPGDFDTTRPRTSPPQYPPGAQLHLAPGPAPSRPPGLRRSSAIFSNPSRRPRQQSLPPLSPSALLGPAAYTRQPAGRTRRISAPLESIPQHSVPGPPSSSHNRRNRYSMDSDSAYRDWTPPPRELRVGAVNRHPDAPRRGHEVRRQSELYLLRTGLVMPQPLHRSSFPSPVDPSLQREAGMPYPMRVGVVVTDNSVPHRLRP